MRTIANILAPVFCAACFGYYLGLHQYTAASVHAAFVVATIVTAVVFERRAA